MKQILVAGTNELAQYYIDMIQTYSNMKIIAIIQTNQPTATTFRNIPIYQDVTAIQGKQIDYIFWCEVNKELSKCKQLLQSNPILLSRTQLQVLKPFVQSFTQQFQYMELILNNIRDGLIIVDAKGSTEFMNDTAKTMLDITPDEDIQLPITELIPSSRLPKVLQHQEKEVNEKLVLANGRQVISTRIPLTNSQHYLIGAFAIFKDSNELVRIAEENSDLKEMKTMLETIIHSSDEPISVVDEHAKGLIVNPAYTRITGLSDKGVIDRPAMIDTYESESIHMKVLKTRRPVKEATLKVGSQKREVIVNASPIIVRGKLKGSVAVTHDVSEINELTTALKQAKQMIRNLEATYTFQDIIGSSSELKIAIEQAKIGARTPVTILLRGDSGTGKELFAHAIHQESERKYHQFIRVNCAALTESTFESMLFGYEKEELSGSISEGKMGLFEEANKGSIFLDDIGELSLSMQMKLLRILQEKEITRVGGTVPIPLDIRIITATNSSLEKAITKGTFREDLYYRLNRLPIHIPSLKERVDDLPDLVDHVLMEVNQKYGRVVSSISGTAIDQLSQYNWPGNIRELENVIGRAVMFMNPTNDIIQDHHLPELVKIQSTSNSKKTKPNRTLQQATEAFEKEFILHVYEEHEFNKTKTSEALGISVRNLYYKLEKYE